MDIEAPATAVYYPHWDVSNPRFLCEALLYWDRLIVLAPDERHRPRGSHPDEAFARQIAALNERFVSPLVPGEAAKAEAHRRLAKFAGAQAPAWCNPGRLLEAEKATLAEGKFLPTTIEMLHANGWAVRQDGGGRATEIISTAAAHVCMAALAGACASDERPAITTSSGDFAAASNLLLAEVEARAGIDPNADVAKRMTGPARAGDDLVVLAQAAVPKVDGDITPERLQHLMALRDKGELDGLRALYRKTTWKHLMSLKAAPQEELDIRLAHLREQLTADRAQLERELERARIGWIINSDGVIATVLTTGGAIAGALTGGAAAIAAAAIPGLLGIATGFRAQREARRTVLARHWTSWLHEVARR